MFEKLAHGSGRLPKNQHFIEITIATSIPTTISLLSTTTRPPVLSIRSVHREPSDAQCRASHLTTQVEIQSYLPLARLDQEVANSGTPVSIKKRGLVSVRLTQKRPVRSTPPAVEAHQTL